MGGTWQDTRNYGLKTLHSITEQVYGIPENNKVSRYQLVAYQCLHDSTGLLVVSSLVRWFIDSKYGLKNIT